MERETRQALLEQKRKRLEELKQKRALNHDTNKFNLLTESIDRKVGVDFAVQVDNVNEAAHEEQIDLSLISRESTEINVFTFDKGVQTDLIGLDIDSVRSVPNPTYLDESSPNTDSNTLEEQLAERLDNEVIDETLNDVAIHQIVNLNEHSNLASEDDDSSAFVITHKISKPNCSILAIDCSSRLKDLIVVAYDSGKLGTAVVYNLKDNLAVAEFTLMAPNKISAIKFDVTSHDKVIAGLIDGRIVIWSLKHNQENQQLHPLQISPILKRYHKRSITSIVLIAGGGDIAFATSDIDGSVNFWSSNYLQSPIVQTVDVHLPSGERVSIKGATPCQGWAVDEEREYRATNSIILGSASGKLLELIGVSTGEVKPFQDGIANNSLSIISSMGALDQDLYVSAHMEWCLKIWDRDTHSVLLSIPTSTYVTQMAINPRNRFQLVTIGMSDVPAVQFWDLKKSAWGPIVDIPTAEGIPLAAVMSHKSNQLTVGFDNGSIVIWKFDEASIAEQYSETPGVDTGIQAYMNSREW